MASRLSTGVFSSTALLRYLSTYAFFATKRRLRSLTFTSHIESNKSLVLLGGYRPVPNMKEQGSCFHVAFARCEGCNKNVAVALISMHNCSLDAKIRVNLEAQVVETQTEAKKKTIVDRKKSTSDEPKPKRLRKANDNKKSSTSNKRKRPLTAFLIFMNDFRKTYEEENPYINVKDVAKHGGEKWKFLTEEEKKVYLDKAAELKAEYNKSLENDANEEEEDEEKQSDADADDVVDAEEKEVDEADENEVENKKAGGKEEEEDEILDDFYKC